MQRDFKGIWIPKKIWNDKELGWTEKLVLVEIDSLDNDEGCFASNQYFSEFFNLSTRRIINIINTLVEKGYLERQLVYKTNSKIIEKRILKVVNKSSLGVVNKTSPLRGEQKFTRGSEQKCTDNNTIYNNTINNNIYSRVIEYLNKKANKKFKHTNKKTKSLIKARLNENFDEEDFIKVIDIKCSHWLDNPDMNEYLRPETLFSNKFESYLNAKEGGKAFNGGTNITKNKSVFS
ncbi:MAG: conserved phage C-terminal domain-containing protein, partial [Peptostreptococcaceae bacterium]